MAIPASELVQINPRVLSGGSGALNFNGLFLTNSTQAQTNTLLTFNSATEVAQYFGYDSPQHKAATVYFNGYDNSLTKPSQCYFYRHPNKDAPAFVRAQAAKDEAVLLKDLKAMTSIKFHLDLGAFKADLDALDFTRAKALSDIAQIIQDAVNDKGATIADGHASEAWTLAKVEYSSLTKAFQITAGEAAPEVGFNAIKGSLAEVIGWTEETNAIISRGMLACTYRETLDNIRAQTGNFVTYTTIEEITNVDDAQSLAEWANNSYNQGDQFLYCFFTSDSSLDATQSAVEASKVGYAKVGKAKVINAKSGRDIVALFLDKAYQGVCGVYGGVEYAAFIMGMTASLDWNQPNSVITYAFKSQAGLSANVTDIKTARELVDLKLNFVGSYACRNDNFTLSMHGMMFGAHKWIDSYINSTWLNNALQTAILNGFKNSPRVPYNETGYTAIKAWCSDVLTKAKNNGVISSGVTLSDAQRNQLEREANSTEICNNLETNGYHLSISADAMARANRDTPAAQMWYTDAGSVHKLVMPVTTVQ